jgi:hypothetical protein
MITLIKTENLPKDAQTSEHLRKQAKYFIEVVYFGKPYYIPVTKEMKKIFGISIRKGEVIVNGSYYNGNRLNNFLQDLISVIYLQVRDTVAAGIHDDLSSQIKNSFEKMFEKGLYTTIEKKLDQKMLTDDSTKKEENHWSTTTGIKPVA